jgi:pimeloyl-ACP methyl ester carboxylesterase
MTIPPLKSGLLTGGLPFVRLGTGTRPLVIFPGLGDSLWDATDATWDLATHYRRFADECTVHVIGRKRGLPPGYTTRQMAADYATAMAHDIGRAHVLGISMGGCIAQYLAADYPQHLERLVIASAAHRTSEEGKRVPLRWIILAREARWRELYFDVLKVTFNEFPHTFYHYIIPLLLRRPSDPSDFILAAEACIAHDGSELLERIVAPTLLIAGKLDAFFPEPILREMTARLPNATLRLIEGVGHGAYEERRDIFETAVLDFIRR